MAPVNDGAPAGRGPKVFAPALASRPAYRHRRHFVLTIRCNDAVGIVAAVASALATAEAFITESSHYGDEATGLFFMRTVFRPTGARSRRATTSRPSSRPSRSASTMRSPCTTPRSA